MKEINQNKEEYNSSYNLKPKIQDTEPIFQSRNPSFLMSTNDDRKLKKYMNSEEQSAKDKTRDKYVPSASGKSEQSYDTQPKQKNNENDQSREMLEKALKNQRK